MDIFLYLRDGGGGCTGGGGVQESVWRRLIKECRGGCGWVIGGGGGVRGKQKLKKNVHIYIIICVCVCVFVCVLSASVTPTPRCRVGGLSGAALLGGIAADGAEKPTSCSTRIATATDQWTPRACVVFECDRCPRWDRERSYMSLKQHT